MTKDKKMEITKRLYKKGVSVTQIASELGCHASTVSKYLAELGIRPKKSIGLEEKVIQLHIQGLTNIEIAYQLECSQTYVYDKLQKAGFRKRYSRYEDSLINADTIYAKDWNALPTEKIIIKEKWNVKDGVTKRIVHHYSDITPIFSPR